MCISASWYSQILDTLSVHVLQHSGFRWCVTAVKICKQCATHYWQARMARPAWPSSNLCLLSREHIWCGALFCNLLITTCMHLLTFLPTYLQYLSVQLLLTAYQPLSIFPINLPPSLHTYVSFTYLSTLPMYNLSSIRFYLGSAIRKHVFGHMRSVKAQISLHGVWSEPSLST